MSVGQIIANAAKVFKVPSRSIIGRAREPQMVDARFAVIWVARETLGYSFPRIGNALDGRDHTSIMHGYRVAGKRRDSDSDYRALLDGMANMRRPTVCPCCDRRWRK